MPIWINVNKHKIASNRKAETPEPPVRFTSGKHGKAHYCNELAILDKDGVEVARVVYDAHKPVLPCGARLAISADYAVRVVR